MNSPISRWCFSLLLAAPLAHGDLAEVNRIYHSTPTLGHLEVCQGGGCYKVTSTSVSDEEWRRVSMLFLPVAADAADERKKIAEAIGLLEEIVGKKVGTSGDLAGTFFEGELDGQQDCNDEATNSTTYMRLLQQGGFIRFHKIEDIRTRSFFYNGWPHSTASLRESMSGELFAVDSWFYDNGHPATIINFDVWKDGYKPADSPVGKTRNVKKPEADTHAEVAK